MTLERCWTERGAHHARAYSPIVASIAIHAQPCQAKHMTAAYKTMTDRARKQVVCEMAMGHLQTAAFAAQLMGLDHTDIDEVSVTAPGPLERQIRVKTTHSGMHYYTVKLTEHV